MSKKSTIIINDSSISPREHIIPIKIEDQKQYHNDEDDDDSDNKNIDNENRRKNIKVIKVIHKNQNNTDDGDDKKDYSVRIPKKQSINRSSSMKKSSKKSTSSSSSSDTSSDSDDDDNNDKRHHYHHSNLISLDKGDRKHSIEILNTTIEGLEGTKSSTKTSFKKQNESLGKIRNKGDINNNYDKKNNDHNIAITTQPGKSILKSSITSSPSPPPVASSTPIPEHHRNTSSRSLSPSNVIRKKPSKSSQCKSWLCSPFALCCACAPFECECCNCCYWKCFRCQQCFCQCCNQKCC